MLWLALIVSCVGLGSAQLDIGPLGDYIHAGTTFNINKTLDRILPRIGEALAKKGYSKIVLPDVGLPASPVLIGVTLEGLPSVIRSGDSQAIVLGPEALGASGVLRLQRPHLSVYVCPYMHSNFTWDIEYIDFEVNVELLPTPKHYKVDCYTRFTHFKVLSVGKIVQYSPNPEFNGVEPDQQILDLVLLEYNTWFSNSQLLSMVNSAFNFCEPS